MPTQSLLSRFFVWFSSLCAALLGALALIAAGCTPEPTPTPVDIDQAATMTVRAGLGAPDTFVYSGVSFTDLLTYRAMFTLSFDGMVGGEARRGTLNMQARVDLGPPAAVNQITVTGDPGVFGSFDEIGTFGKTYLAGVDYITTGEANCLPQPINLFDPLAYNILRPEMLFQPNEAPRLTLVGPGPSVGGAPTWRFRAEDFSTATLQHAALDILVADRGAHIVRVDLQGEGYVPGQRSAHGTVKLYYELSGLNQPVGEISRPAVCRPTPTPEPSPVATSVLSGD
ncbi:MAG: hypothetical protein JXB47_04830 [Anaerolineae bacterium]|nr:hypothetical protein [Anaerolineae bacterium]